MLRAIVEEKPQRRWSPEQIAGWLNLTYPKRPEMQVSHESIYRTVYVQSRGALRRELTRYLRTGRVITGSGKLAFLEARHRAHAPVEDRIRHAEDSGLGRFPSREFKINQPG